MGINLHKELPMVSRHPPRRITTRTTRCQESAKKNNSKNYQASRICQEELQQELPGLKNPPRRNTARITRHQESSENNRSKNYQASRIRREEIQQENQWCQDTRREELSPEEKVVFKILGILQLMLDAGSDTLSGVMWEQGVNLIR